MSRLTAEQRKKIPKKKFAVKKMKSTGKPGFPIDSKQHAKSAIKLAGRSYSAGNISKSTETKIQSRARNFLKKKGK